jgi:hypothetical protein
MDRPLRGCEVECSLKAAGAAHAALSLSIEFSLQLFPSLALVFTLALTLRPFSVRLSLLFPLLVLFFLLASLYHPRV